MGYEPLTRKKKWPGRLSLKKAVVLLSGGVDSTTTLAIARDEGFEVYALSFDYGQRHRHEVKAARRVARHLGARKHLVMKVNLRTIGASALTADVEVPKKRHISAMPKDIPTTYVPARNAIFLSIALAWAEAIGARDIFFGANVIDYSGYPDCRPEFVRAFERMANLATKAGVENRRRSRTFRIHTPLIYLTKGDIIKRGIELGANYALTHTCYDPGPDGRPCNSCDSCLLRARGFSEAGVDDPLGTALHR